MSTIPDNKPDLVAIRGPRAPFPGNWSPSGDPTLWGHPLVFPSEIKPTIKFNLGTPDPRTAITQDEILALERAIWALRDRELNKSERNDARFGIAAAIIIGKNLKIALENDPSGFNRRYLFEDGGAERSQLARDLLLDYRDAMREYTQDRLMARQYLRMIEETLKMIPSSMIPRKPGPRS